MPWKTKSAVPPAAPKTAPEAARPEVRRDVDPRLLRRAFLRAPTVLKPLTVGDWVLLHGAR